MMKKKIRKFPEFHTLHIFSPFKFSTSFTTFLHVMFDCRVWKWQTFSLPELPSRNKHTNVLGTWSWLWSCTFSTFFFNLVANPTGNLFYSVRTEFQQCWEIHWYSLTTLLFRERLGEVATQMHSAVKWSLLTVTGKTNIVCEAYPCARQVCNMHRSLTVSYP